MTVDVVAASIEQLVGQWTATKSHHGKALLEDQLWALAASSVRREWPRSQWLATLLVKSAADGSFRDIVGRQYLSSGGLPVEPLWAELDVAGTSLTVTRAYELWRRAKKHAAQTTTPLIQAVTVALNEWKALPERRVTGGVMRRHRPHPKRVPRASVETWRALRDSIIEQVKAKVGEVDESMMEDFYSEMTKDVVSLIDQWRSRLRTKKAFTATFTGASTSTQRSKLVKACHTLNVDVPKMGCPVDAVKAHRHMRQLAKAYHPDTAGSGNRDSFEAVITADQVIKMYNQQLNERKVAP